MALNVTVIPPKAVQPDILRVAAYCRVSSDSADQRHSYATQIKEYTERINGHAGWELVDVYADEYLDTGNCLRRTSRKYIPLPSVSWLQSWRMKPSMTVSSATGLFHWPPSEHWRQ